MIIGDRMHFANGQPIPPNSAGRNLQAKIDTWLAGSTAAVPPHPSDPAFTRDPPPHATHCFEIALESSYGQPVQRANIVEVPPAKVASELTDEGEEDIDLFEVFTTERRKHNAKTTQLPELTQDKESEERTNPTITSNSTIPPPSTPKPREPALLNKDEQPQHMQHANAPSTFNTNPLPPSRIAPQYRYISNAEDQWLSSELFKWLLEGKLSLATPAHILAASAGIRKELIEHLKTRKVDTASFEELSYSNATSPSSLPKLSTPHSAEYSLPLREIDVLVNGMVPEAGILDQGSQIIVMRQDLAQEAGVRFNTSHQLDMEGTNGLASKTMGCAENLTMQIGDVVFEVHAHIVERAPF